MNKTVSALVVFLLVLGSVAGAASSATALEPVPDLYTVNVADQNASSDARDYVVLDGTTYFTASSVSYGRSIWSLAAAAGSQPQLVLDPVDGVVHGDMQKMVAVGDYLLFWLNSQFNGRGVYTAVSYNLTTKTMTPLTAGGTAITSSSEVMSNFAVVTGEGGSVAYVIGGENADNSQKLYAVNLATGVASVADNMVGVRVTNSVRQGLVASGQYWHPTLVSLGSKVYVADYVGAETPAGLYCYAPADWSELRAFDTGTGLWESPIRAVGDDFPLAGVSVLGTFDYAGERMVLSAAASVMGCYFSHTFQYYATKSDGTTFRLGTWSTSNRPGTDSYVNFKGNLYFMQGDVALAGLWLIDPATGEKTNVATGPMFPGSTEVELFNAVVIGERLVFAAQVRPTARDTAQPIYLYQWDGSSAATRLASAPTGQAIDVVERAASVYWWQGNYNRDGQASAAIGVVGTTAITSLYVDGSTGGEPYRVALDDTATLVGNLNTASDGSNPDTDCYANFDNVDVIAGHLPIQSEPRGKDVFVELKGEDGYLKYSVLDPGVIEGMCGFVVIGDAMYFTADDPDTYQTALYRMGADRVVTKVVDVEQESYQGFTNGTDYIYRGSSDYDTDLWMWNAATGEVVQLTGTGSDLIQEDSVDSAVQIGSIVYFTGRAEIDDKDSVWALDLTDPTAPPVRITPPPATGIDSSPDTLAVVNGTLVFSNTGVDGSGAAVGGKSVYVYDPATKALRLLFDPVADGASGWVERIFAVGNDVVVIYHADADPWDTSRIFRATLAGVVTELTFPATFSPYCAAPAGNDIAVSSDAGVAYFYRQGGDTMVPIDYSFAGDTSALCYSVSSVNGTYLSIPEYPFDGGPWASEAGYLGFLTPIAVERLGEPVDEPPASPYSATPPPADAPGAAGDSVATVGDGSIDLSWSAPATGGAPGGYRITSNPAGALCVIVGTSASCTGLTVGEAYTFTVEAYNVNGFGPASKASNSVVAPEGSDVGFGGGGGTGGDGGTDGGTDGDGGTGGGDGSTDGEPGGSGTGGLAFTGFDGQWLIPLGVVLLGVGAALVVLTARRPSAR